MTHEDQLRAAVRERLTEMGWTQTELARRANIRPNHLNRWLRGYRPHLHPMTLDRIIRAAGLKIEVTIGTGVAYK